MKSNKLKYKVVFHAIGFVPDFEMTPQEWETVKAEFVELNNAFARGINEQLPKLNEIWEKYEMMKDLNDEAMVRSMREIMGVDKDWDLSYGDWLSIWYNETASIVNNIGRKLKSDIFMDGDYPVYGACMKDHPEWKIHVTIQPEE